MTASRLHLKAVKQPWIITCFAGGIRFFSWEAVFDLCQMSLLLLQPQNSIFNAFVWSTLLQKAWSLLNCSLSNCSFALTFLVLLVRLPCRSDLCFLFLIADTNSCERYLQTQQIRKFLETFCGGFFWFFLFFAKSLFLGWICLWQFSDLLQIIWRSF